MKHMKWAWQPLGEKTGLLACYIKCVRVWFAVHAPNVDKLKKALPGN